MMIEWALTLLVVTKADQKENSKEPCWDEPKVMWMD